MGSLRGIRRSNQQPLWQGERGQQDLPNNVKNLRVYAITGRETPTQIYPDMAPKECQTFQNPGSGATEIASCGVLA